MQHRRRPELAVRSQHPQHLRHSRRSARSSAGADRASLPRLRALLGRVRAAAGVDLDAVELAVSEDERGVGGWVPRAARPPPLHSLPITLLEQRVGAAEARARAHARSKAHILRNTTGAAGRSRTAAAMAKAACGDATVATEARGESMLTRGSLQGTTRRHNAVVRIKTVSRSPRDAHGHAATDVVARAADGAWSRVQMHPADAPPTRRGRGRVRREWPKEKNLVLHQYLPPWDHWCSEMTMPTDLKPATGTHGGAILRDCTSELPSPTVAAASTTAAVSSDVIGSKQMTSPPVRRSRHGERCTGLEPQLMFDAWQESLRTEVP